MDLSREMNTPIVASIGDGLILKIEVFRQRPAKQKAGECIKKLFLGERKSEYSVP